MNPSNLKKCVYTFNQEYIAQMSIKMLSDSGIEASMINKRDSMYHFGSIEIYVSEINFEKAKDLLIQFENQQTVE